MIAKYWAHHFPPGRIRISGDRLIDEHHGFLAVSNLDVAELVRRHPDLPSLALAIVRATLAGVTNIEQQFENHAQETRSPPDKAD